MNSNIFKGAEESLGDSAGSSDASMGVDRGQGDLDESLLNREHFYMELLSIMVKNDPNANGSASKEMVQEAKNISDILIEKFPDELTASKEKELGPEKFRDKLWELYKSIEKK